MRYQSYHSKCGSTHRARSRSKSKGREVGVDATYEANSGVRKTAKEVVMSMPESPPRRAQSAGAACTIYPSWWGHREHIGIRRHASCPEPVEKVTEKIEFLPNWSYPKKMIDEMTQTAKNACVRAPTPRQIPEPGTEARGFYTVVPDEMEQESDGQPERTDQTVPKREAWTAPDDKNIEKRESGAGKRTTRDDKPIKGRPAPKSKVEKRVSSKRKGPARALPAMDETWPIPTNFFTHEAEATANPQPQTTFTFTVSPPRQTDQPKPKLVDIASSFLKSDIMELLDLTVLDMVSDDEDADNDGGNVHRVQTKEGEGIR